MDNERRFEIRYSPHFTNEILGNGGIKAKVKHWRKITGTPIKAEISDGALRLYEVEKK
jgi:hypothetical protein